MFAALLIRNQIVVNGLINWSFDREAMPLVKMRHARDLGHPIRREFTGAFTTRDPRDFKKKLSWKVQVRCLSKHSLLIWKKKKKLQANSYFTSCMSSYLYRCFFIYDIIFVHLRLFYISEKSRATLRCFLKETATKRKFIINTRSIFDFIVEKIGDIRLSLGD